jgi:hypothetical protein
MAILDGWLAGMADNLFKENTDNRTNNYLQSTTHKTKDRATQTHSKNRG